MSQERVDQILRAYEALNRGDFEALAVHLRPEFEFIPPPMLPEGEVYHGPDGLRQLWQRWSGAFDNFRIEVEEAIDAGDRVIVMAAVAGTGLDSGMEVKTPSFAWVWSFDGDEVVRMEAMPNRATALEAVGLGLSE
jgi:ketosteroid isomerase-like protein